LPEAVPTAWPASPGASVVALAVLTLLCRFDLALETARNVYSHRITGEAVAAAVGAGLDLVRPVAGDREIADLRVAARGITSLSEDGVAGASQLNVERVVVQAAIAGHRDPVAGLGVKPPIVHVAARASRTEAQGGVKARRIFGQRQEGPDYRDPSPGKSAVMLENASS
jgi:hypothetical protein